MKARKVLFNLALKRVELGLATSEDAKLIRGYVDALETRVSNLERILEKALEAYAQVPLEDSEQAQA